VKDALQKAADHFGGIDILVNNASAIDNRSTAALSPKRYDLMHSINGRGTFMVSKYALPHLLKGSNPQVLNLSPPLDCLDPPGQPAVPEWFRLCGVGYSMAKFNMSMCAIGMAEEYRGRVGFSCLWPRTAIATAAIENLAGEACHVTRARAASPPAFHPATRRYFVLPHPPCRSASRRA